jgi:hypothetical protein
MNNDKNNIVNSEENIEKEVWNTPVITELNIESGTKNNVSGPSLNDGGNSFDDYNS